MADEYPHLLPLALARLLGAILRAVREVVERMPALVQIQRASEQRHSPLCRLPLANAVSQSSTKLLLSAPHAVALYTHTTSSHPPSHARAGGTTGNLGWERTVLSRVASGQAEAARGQQVLVRPCGAGVSRPEALGHLGGLEHADLKSHPTRLEGNGIVKADGYARRSAAIQIKDDPGAQALFRPLGTFRMPHPGGARRPLELKA